MGETLPSCKLDDYAKMLVSYGTVLQRSGDQQAAVAWLTAAVNAACRLPDEHSALILGAYAQDLRGPYARHAQAILDESAAR